MNDKNLQNQIEILKNKIKQHEVLNNNEKKTCNSEKEINANRNTSELEKINKHLKITINKLENKIQLLNNQIKELNIELNEKDEIIKIKNEELNKNIKEKINYNNYSNRIIEFQDELKESKSILPFELLKGEKLMSIIFISNDESILHSMICKNADKFVRLEYLLYEEYPEYKIQKIISYLMGKK